ncbi:hypothetical protein RUM43_004921 [Polyplax serrata]|uniref:Uncharacterized protein n=1 Tax=Polyplax serrata TaxID=468196 RepID=A0AAN8SC93_POLSC
MKNLVKISGVWQALPYRETKKLNEKRRLSEVVKRSEIEREREKVKGKESVSRHAWKGEEWKLLGAKPKGAAAEEEEEEERPSQGPGVDVLTFSTPKEDLRKQKFVAYTKEMTFFDLLPREEDSHSLVKGRMKM